jgi:hypothetical protein
MRQAALKSVLSSFAHNKAILAVEKIRLLEKSSGFYWFIFVAIRRDTMKAH